MPGQRREAESLRRALAAVTPEPPPPPRRVPPSQMSFLMQWKGPSARGFCPGSLEIRGAQFRQRTRNHCGPSVPYKAGRSRRAARGRSTGAPWPPRRRCPASPRAPQCLGRGLPRRGHARRGAGALLPGVGTSRSRRGPGLGGGACRGGGVRPAAGVRLLR